MPHQWPHPGEDDMGAGSPAPSENRIVEVKLTLDPTTGDWTVAVTKEFAPEYGGGFQVFTESGGGHVHRALDVARGTVTLSPGQRTDLTAGSGRCGCCGDEVRAGGCS